MSTTARKTTPGWLLGLAVLIAAADPAAGQDARPSLGQGFHAFRHILNECKLKPLASTDDLAEEPEKTLLVVFGDTEVLGKIPGGLGRFVEQGGALLVATDRNTEIASPLATFGFVVQEGPLRVSSVKSRSAYRRQFVDCPILSAIPATNPSLFAGFTKGVVANRPGWLRRIPKSNSLPELVVFWDCVPAHVTSGHLRPFFFRLPAAAGGDWGNGRALILADHSIFINSMMLQPDTDNFDFAYNCIQWLTGPGQRDRVLYLEEDEVVTNFEVPLREVPPPPLPPVEELVTLANNVMAGLENEDFFNQLLLDNVEHEAILRAALLAITVALGVLLASRLIRARHRHDAHVPALAGSLAQMAPVETVVEQRHQALLRQGNLREAAVDLARGWFAESLPHRGQENAPPLVTATGGWWQRRRMRRQVRDLWRLARGDRQTPVSVAEFNRLIERIGRLRAALAGGTLGFDEPLTRPAGGPRRFNGRLDTGKA